jgi:mono/diheme cytochrome c family protein
VQQSSVSPNNSRGRILGAAAVGAALLFSATATPGERTMPADAVARAEGTTVMAIVDAAQDFARNCAGCHGHTGVSVPQVPALKDRVGYFLHTPEGRRFVVQVPGVATNVLDDTRLAAVLNWMLFTYSRPQLPPDFHPYTAKEVGLLRRAPLLQVIPARQKVVHGLLDAGVIAREADLGFYAFSQLP